MRKGEPERVVKIFAKMGIPVDLVDAKAEFLGALKGLTDPEEKRNAVTNTFYAKVFGRLVRETGAKFLLHGTILTDIEETMAGSSGNTTSLHSSALIQKRNMATRF